MKAFSSWYCIFMTLQLVHLRHVMVSEEGGRRAQSMEDNFRRTMPLNHRVVRTNINFNQVSHRVVRTNINFNQVSHRVVRTNINFNQVSHRVVRTNINFNQVSVTNLHESSTCDMTLVTRETIALTASIMLLVIWNARYMYMYVTIHPQLLFEVMASSM